MPQNVVVPPFTVAPTTVVGGTPQTEFEFEFPFWDAEDVLVYVDDVALAADAYTVTGAALQDGEAVEGGYGSGTVTLDAAVSNVTVKIDRLVTGSRETQFARSAPLDMRALNGDLNRIVARQQDLKRKLDAMTPEMAAADAAIAAAQAAIATAKAVLTAADAVATAADRAQTTADAVATAADRVAAAESAATASLAALGDGVWPTATANVPRGVTGHGPITGGSGGTDGTFAFSVSGGNFSVNPTGTFTVSGGALTAIDITGEGEYIGASPTAPTLVLTASAGLTGASATLTVDFLVGSGRTYWANHATDTTRYQLFQNVAGVATLKTNMTLPKGLPDPVTVWLEYVQAADWETTNKYFLRPIQNITLTGGLTQYRFRWAAPFTNAVGAYTVHIIKYGTSPAADGTIVAGTSVTGNSGVTTGNGGIVTIFAADGTSAPAVGDITQYSLLAAQRNPASGSGFPGAVDTYRLIESTDRITPTVAKAFSAASPIVQFASPIRPFNGIKTGPNTIVCGVHPHDDWYAGSEDRRQSDMDISVLFDMGDFQGIESAPALNSRIIRRYGQYFDSWNHTFDNLEGAIVANNGHVPSTAETVVMVGIDGGAAASLAGRGHGQETADADAWDLRLTKNDDSTSNVDSESANLAAAPIGYRFEGDKLVSTWGGYSRTPGGTATNALKSTYVHKWESAETHAIDVEITLDETDPGVTASIITVPGGYACMGPFREITHLRPLKVTPATGAVTEYGTIIECNKRDATTTTLVGDWNAVEGWDARRPEMGRDRLINMAGPGYTHWEGAKIDANRVARTADWFVIMQGWGSKAYDPIYSNAGAGLSLTGKVIRTHFRWVSIFDDEVVIP